MNYSGIAAADELDALNSRDDFEPSVEVDTAALDATIEALRGAKALVRTLEALRANLAAAGDADEATGLAIDVQTIAARLGGVLADVTVGETFEVRAGEVVL